MKRIVLVLFAVLAPAAHADRVRLVVRGSADVERVADAPVTAGIAWPRGALRKTDSLRLLDRGGRELPLQVCTLARWPDGSVQWTLLDFQAALRRTAPVAFVLDTGAAPRKAAPAHPVEVRESADHVAHVLQEALASHPGAQWLTDQGTPYMASTVCEALEALEVEHAPQREGDPQAKSPLERAFRSAFRTRAGVR